MVDIKKEKIFGLVLLFYLTEETLGVLNAGDTWVTTISELELPSNIWCIGSVGPITVKI